MTRCPICNDANREVLAVYKEAEIIFEIDYIDTDNRMIDIGPLLDYKSKGQLEFVCPSNGCYIEADDIINMELMEEEKSNRLELQE